MTSDTNQPSAGNVDNQDSNKGDEESQGGSKENDKQTNAAVDPNDWRLGGLLAYDGVLRVAMGGGSAAAAGVVGSPDDESAVRVPVGSKMQLARVPVWQAQREN